ncbi:MAG: ABC transporter ATP-binding protein [Candidatus Omnitrophica bacterium]|nr:ABC transporter ATP-binding protein [Candidatus Omnitrophota bacterium]
MIETNKKFISVRNLIKKFEGRIVLDNINIDIQQGETFVIVGGSGSGKSTLLRTMTGAIRPDQGEVYYDGKDIHSMEEDEMDKFRKRFGMSFQNSALLDFLSVEENVSLPLVEHTRLDQKLISIIAKMKLKLVGLQGFENYQVSQLSGGMRKRVGLARAIAMDPEIVFYDEPTAGLDPVVCAVVDQLILDLTKKLNLTSVVVTHNMESVFRIADRIGMLYKGKMLQVGTKEEIQNSTNPVIQQFIKGEINGPIHLNEDVIDR